MQINTWHKWSKGEMPCLTLIYNIFEQLNSNACAVSVETLLLRWPLVLRPQLERVGRRGGQNKLSTEDQLLITLEYWREYRAPVSHRYKLGTARDHSRADDQKSRKLVN